MMIRILPPLALITILALLAVHSKHESYRPILASVSVTNFSGNSGGSGSIISNSPTESRILTNKHVCGLIHNGGMVHSGSSSSSIVSYLESEAHDLCVITVAEDLHSHVDVAPQPPVPMSDSTVYGHPRLLPLIKSIGHFSGKMVVSILIGRRECTDAERQSPDSGVLCAILGFMPIIGTYESIVTSATIQPGSSGSGVYDSDNRVAAVIFAGAGDFGYGLAVPQEYVYNFLMSELPTKSYIPVGAQLLSLNVSSSLSKNDMIAVEKVCSNPKTKHACSERLNSALTNSDKMER